MSFSAEEYDPATSDTWLVCTQCGTQFPSDDRNSIRTCRLCDDPRGSVPASGQAFTTMADLKAQGHRNVFEEYASDSRICYITSQPEIGIGQRATLLQTRAGNILWDCITLLDDETMQHIRGRGGLRAIVISHPHFYSAHVQWARAFRCPVFLAAADAEWTTMRSGHQVLATDVETEILDTGAKMIRVGGHFPGSMVLLYDRHAFIADTIMMTPAGFGNWKSDAMGRPRQRPPGQNSFAFLWSFPNRIPLGPDEIARMWSIIRNYEFDAAHGSFAYCDMEDLDAKARLLDSMQMQIRAMGHPAHPLLNAVTL
ncbi:hypothetical protein NLG97_g2209 [Lecanicillium saksenae]|uniref:Uncharacterized protein n=1 Tax=Lecanicillium saksenae TaxID=468837 RepID=A0ACC1R3E8_9HYPO|nr:hypothetical protein NLG97_g2209 [Lecanicillium saksenae]